MHAVMSDGAESGIKGDGPVVELAISLISLLPSNRRQPLSGDITTTII
jgi:hypothetical protein